MTEGHIFIQGVISPWQDKAAEEWGEVNIKQVTQQIQNNAEAEKLIVHIHSPGGDVDEGFGIHDILVASGKVIETRIEGLCASIATVIALAGSIRMITENSEFMIHNPWGGSMGDADDLQKSADQMKVIENKIIDFYAAKTGKSKDDLDKWMKDETWLTSAQALDLGFVTEIITTMKAVAHFKVKNSNKTIVMNPKELDTAIESKFNKFFDRIKALIGAKGAVNVTVTTGDGTVLDFGSQAATPEEIAVGMTATIEGGDAPDGDYVMPDGGIWVFVKGELTEMKEAPAEDVEALKKKITDLEAELEAEKAANLAVVDEVQKEIVAMKKQIKSDIKSFDPKSLEREGGGAENRAAGMKPKIGM